MPSAAVGKKENELKAHLDGNKLDLSLMQHEAITPALVRQIAAIPKATEVDLSCNRLETIAPQFCSLSQVSLLDLSKNRITQLPDEIGQMTGLRHLDLSGNKIVSLPLSFAELENLRWLDLKDNPLEPHLASVAGDCLDKKQCMNAAKQVCVYMRNLAEVHERELEKKKKKKENLDEKKQRKKEEKERIVREEQKAVKKTEKEKKRRDYEERRIREQKQVENIGPMGDIRDTDSEAESDLRRRSALRSKSSSSSSFCASLFRFILRLVKTVFFLSLACAVVGAVVVAWCQGSRRHQSPVCASARDVIARAGAASGLPALTAFDFDDFCDAAANRTLAAAEAARLRLADAGTAMRPWAEKVFLFYDDRVAPHLTTAREKSHCFFCHLFDATSGFYQERLLPTLRLAWAYVSEKAREIFAVASELFLKHILPTLIVLRDRIVEIYLLLLEELMRICDLYVFPGCEKIFASAANIFHGLKTTT